MKKLNTSIYTLKNKNYFINSQALSVMLIGFIWIACYVIDYKIINSNLILPLTTALICASILTKLGIKQFNKFRLNQIIRKEGPERHKIKEGTPSMGGIIIVPLGLLISNIINFNQGINKELIGISILGIGFMLIGAIDDLYSYSLKQNTGLKPLAKIILQLTTGIIFLIFSYSNNIIDSRVYLWNNQAFDFGFLIWPLSLFIILAESNATNLTDGLDGLASGCGAIVLTGMSTELILRGNPQDFQMASLCIAIAGTWLGFLLHNKNPAKVFMGDTGSLAMGALLAGIGLISNTLWGLLIMGIIFLVESLSVIIQVFFFKLSKKLNGKGYRLFKMAPLHHHFELNGQEEVAIVRNFWMISIIFVFLRLFFL